MRRGMAVPVWVALSVVLGSRMVWPQADYVVEPQKRIPVIYDVDVAVAGGGVSGICAAVAAARSGARTILVDRMGSVGGMWGPGYKPPGGSQAPGPYSETEKADRYDKAKGGYPAIWVYPEIAGISKEFIQRIERLSDVDQLSQASAVSYVGTRLLREAGVELLVSTYVTDPIMEGTTVKGLFVENKSGRGAIKAKVVIDATGEADVARRAGAPALYPKEIYSQVDGHSPNGFGLSAIVGGIDWERFSGKRIEFPGRNLGGKGTIRPAPSLNRLTPHSNLAVFAMQLKNPEPPLLDYAKLNAGDGKDMALLETELRLFIFDAMQEYRRKAPGCENLFIVAISPYLGLRGGPCIEGEYTFTLDDAKVGKRFDDVIYLFGENRALQHTCLKEGKCKWVDVPYRVMVPKKIDGLLAVGRSASAIPDTALRNVTAVQHMGQAGGTAAALAVRKNVRVRDLNVKELQVQLLKEGFYLGDEARLRELGLRR
ncbi:MAG: FAD-dependent oxidoreductase [Acidobacteria bacterium]|nr:FAD-dependent oxidoreductase [Acidobacteriota bacterium]